MMGIAAGLSTTGIVPFASTFAMFAAGRAFEQVRNSIGYPHLNVKIGATHAGISVGEDGATHQCNEDIALMRTIPGMVILNPADDVEAKACVKAAYEYNGPVYLRFGRLAVPVINDRPDYKFELGKGVVLREGKDVTIVATGLCVSSALEAAEKLAADGIDAKIINIHTIKPLDEELIVAADKRDRQSRNRRRALGDRRTWKRSLRCTGREMPGSSEENRCTGRLRRVRPGSRSSCKIQTRRRGRLRAGKRVL